MGKPLVAPSPARPFVKKAKFTDAPWSTPESDLDAADYCACCLIDENESGKDKIKDNCALPIKDTPGGPINKNALRNAASRLPQVRGFSAEAKSKAAKRLAALKKEAGIGEDDSDSSKSISLTITKQANGRYRWTGTSSCNAKDRDGEIVSKMALEMDVLRTKNYGDDSKLKLFHIPGADIGGAPDFRAVVDGLLIESGEFDDTPFARGVAEYAINHPLSDDGSGWGMSIGFNGVPDLTATYKQIETVERSLLPLSQAANPYTNFKLEKESDMALKAAQRQLLEAMSAEIKDPEFAAVAKQIAAAADQSKSLDADGVRRKDVTSTNAQYAHGPGGLFNTPGTGKRRKAEQADSDDDTDDYGGGDSNEGYHDSIHGNQKCADCGHRASDHQKDDSVDGYGGCTKCKCKSFKMIGASQDDAGDLPPGGKSIKSLTYDELADAIAEHTKDALDEALEDSPVVKQLVRLTTELGEMVVKLTDSVVALESGEEAVRKQYERPRILSDLLASRSGGSRIDGNDPLVRQTKSAERRMEKEAREMATYTNNPFDIMPGFKEAREAQQEE